MGASSLFAGYASLLRSHSDLGTLLSTCSELETKMPTVKSDIQLLQNQVRGDSASALLETDVSKMTSRDSVASSLESRVNTLEKEVAESRTQVTSLEQKVVG